MKATVGIYDSHEQAVNAIAELKDADYPVTHLSILGKADSEVVADKEMHIIPKDPIKLGGVEAGTTLGVTLGVLSGVGLFAIPGFGFLYGAGALVGIIAGLDFGLIGGGIVSALATFGAKDEVAEKYKKYLNEGKYLVIAQGTQDEIDKAKNILGQQGTYNSLVTH